MAPDFWVAPLIGGALIGLAAAMLMLFHGRIAGISGILGGLLTGDHAAWRAIFIAGLVIGGLVWFRVDPGAFAFTLDRSHGALALAGLAVGVGTRMGNGCTSGHGVCGIARLSRRSLLATMVFMTTGVLTVYVVQHLLGGAV